MTNNGSDGYEGTTVSAYSINPSTGALLPVPGSSFAAGNVPGGVTFNPTGTFAYMTSWGADGTVSAFRINPDTGALMPVPDSPFAAGNRPEGVTVNPAGTFAYVTNRGADGTVSAFRINPDTGALTPVPGSPFAAGWHAHPITINPAGTFAYVTNGSRVGNGTVSAFRINPDTGALTPVPGSPFAAGGFPDSVTINPAGTFAYVVIEGYTDSVSAYRINAGTGALTPVPGSPSQTQLNSISVTIVQTR